MASELSWRHTATGETVYATIRSAARTMWNTAGSTLEALTVANWADYDIALTETPGSSYFHVGTWPAALSTVGWYWVDVYKQVGAGPAISDTLLGTLYGYWNGTLFEPAGGDMKQVNGTAQTARDVGGALPAAAPGANGGLPTTNGTKVNQTVDLTAGQSMLVSVGTGAGQINVASGKVPATIAAGDLATDSITAAALKADAATEIAAAVAANASILKVLAFAAGKVVITGSSWAFYASDNTTILFTLTVDANGRTVA